MAFVDEFEQMMTKIRDSHTNKEAELLNMISKCINERDEYQAKADELLIDGDVSVIVNNRIMVEKKNKEYEVYSDRMKVAHQEILISPSEYLEYCKGIISEYGEQMHEGYKKLLDCIESVRDAIKEINVMATEEEACFRQLDLTTAATDNKAEYVGKPFTDSFFVPLHVAEKLCDTVTISTVKAKIGNYAQYVSKDGDENV